MLPSIKRRLLALGPAAVPFADTTPGIWLLELPMPTSATPISAASPPADPAAPEPRPHTAHAGGPAGRRGGASGC